MAAVNVPVTVTGSSTGRLVIVRSDRYGAFKTPPVPPGHYFVQAVSGGFGASLQVRVGVSDGMEARQDLVLAEAVSSASKTRNQGRAVDACGALAGNREQGAGGCDVATRAGVASPFDGTGRDPVSETRATRFPPAGARLGFSASPAKRGSNEFHGALYHELGNDKLDARGFFGRESRSQQKPLRCIRGRSCH